MTAEPALSPGSPRRRAIVFLPVVLFAALALLLILRLYAGDASVVPSALIGREAPKLDLPPLAELRQPGGEAVPGVPAATLRDGTVSVVNVFASWCGPCRQEHPLLLGLARSGVRLVGINQKDEAENARRFLGALGNPYRAVGVDPNGRASIEWGVYGVPETFVVDGKGIIRYKQVGPLSPETLPALRQAIGRAGMP